ncbi:MAG: hypothetical protein Q4C22_03305 [Bacillota bacterium]|nr:hypothetical protein [Bacillota bacterium]
MITNKEAYCTDFQTGYKGNSILVRSRLSHRSQLFINGVEVLQGNWGDANVLTATLQEAGGVRRELKAVLEGGGYTECHIYLDEELIYSSQQDWEEMAAEAQARARHEEKKSKWLLAAALVVSLAMVATYSVGFFFAADSGLEIPVVTKIKEVAWQWFGWGDGGAGDGEQTPPDGGEESYRNASYEWTYGIDQWNYELSIPLSAYEYFRGIDRSGIYDYSYFVEDPTDDAYMAALTDAFRAAAAEEAYNDRQTVEFIISFVQGLEYVSDIIGTGYDEYPKFPLETLVDEGGDCEDSAILLASLLKEMGYGAVLIQTEDHMAVGIAGDDTMTGVYYEWDGRRYFYVETTSPGWIIGEVPPEVEGQAVTLLSIQ